LSISKAPGPEKKSVNLTGSASFWRKKFLTDNGLNPYY
jgi:hypothetical protein